jgi:predicted acyltransferase
MERIYSVDAFRGFTMVCMIGEGFGLAGFRNHAVLGGLAEQFRHADWNGMNAWDLVQPFFMFIVGVVMPVSFGRRWDAGDSWAATLRHVLKRSALLILFGLIARSIQANRPVVDLINVLAQLAFTYFMAFLVLRRGWMTQGTTALGLLALHWAIYVYGQPAGAVGPWEHDANAGWYLDGLLLGKHWGGGYATINCLSSASATIWGVMAGRLLLKAWTPAMKIGLMCVSALSCFALGNALNPLIPINKKIWTASFAFVSIGWTLLALALFYWLCDVRRWRGWATVFVIVGANSIFIYIFHEVLHRWLAQSALVFTGWAVNWWGPWGKALQVWAVILFEIYACYWLWRRKIFFKI